MLCKTRQVRNMNWVDFKWAFKKEDPSTYILHVIAQEFINLMQGNILVKEFFTKLNALAK